MKNYFEFTGQTKNVNNTILHRVQLIKNCKYGERGYIGGWIENKSNLQGGWVYDNAMVFNKAIIHDDVRIFDNVIIYNNASVYDNVRIFGYVIIKDNVIIKDDVIIKDNVIIKDDAVVKEGAIIGKNVFIQGNAIIGGSATIQDNAVIGGSAIIGGSAKIVNDTIIGDTVNIIDNTVIKGGVWHSSPLQIQGSRHYINMCNKKDLKIGCMAYPIEYWKQNYKRIGKIKRYTEEEIEEYKLYIDLADKLYNK